MNAALFGLRLCCDGKNASWRFAFRIGVGLVGVMALLVGRVHGAEAGPDFSKLTAFVPCPALVAAAQSDHIPLDRIDPAGEPGRLDVGDSFTGLVTLFEKGGKQTQWLLYLETQPLTTNELTGKPPRRIVLYSGRSNKLEYVSSLARVRLRTLGPFSAGSGHAKSEDHSDSFSLDKGFLGLGLEQASAKIYQKQQSKADGKFWFGPEPPNATQIAEGRKLAEVLHLTDAEERSLGGLIPALLSYFDVIQHTEGLEDIMLKVVRKPSIWSVVSHLGVSVDFDIDSKHLAPASLEPWGLPASQVAYDFPMLLELNHERALTVTFVVTSPRPPLLSCGGVIGMLAEKPGDKETYLTLRIISARYKGAK